MSFFGIIAVTNDIIIRSLLLRLIVPCFRLNMLLFQSCVSVVIIYHRTPRGPILVSASLHPPPSPPLSFSLSNRLSLYIFVHKLFVDKNTLIPVSYIKHLKLKTCRPLQGFHLLYRSRYLKGFKFLLEKRICKVGGFTLRPCWL